MVLIENARKEAVEQEIAEGGVGCKSLFDLAEEATTDNAAAPPHEGNAAHVEVPSVLLCRGAQQHVALGIGDDLGAVKGPAHIFNERGSIANGGFRVRSLEHGRRSHALFFKCREAAAENRLADECDRLAKIERTDDCPLTGSLLTGSVKDLVDERRAIFIFRSEDVARDLDEIAVELSLVPIGEDGVQFVRSQAEPTLEQVDMPRR